MDGNLRRMDEQRAIISQVLEQVVDPCSVAMGVPLHVHEMGLLKQIEVKESGDVTIHLRMTSPTCTMVAYFIREIEERIGELPGIHTVVCEVDNGLEWEPSMMTKEALEKRMAHLRKLDQRLIYR